MEHTSIIKVDNLKKTYHLGQVEVKALCGVSLEIEKGEFLIITGRSGSGKSTLLHQLGLLDLPDSGEIIINGKKVNHLNERERGELRLKSLGYIFQEYALIAELTALENVMLPAMMTESTKRCKKRAIELMQQVGLEHRLHNLPAQLSGGEQQRVAIARALVNNPKIIFADEPTANLDTRSAHDVMEIFKKINQEEERTIIMITHEPEETSYASRLIVLSDGRLT